MAVAVLRCGGGAYAATPLQKAVVQIDGRIMIEVEVARNPMAQAEGLAGRSSLEKGKGMLFPYDAVGHRAFWMKGMLIPLDILWIQDGRIVAIEANLPPPSIGGAPAIYGHPADLVLEVPAGYAEEAEIRVGQSVRVRYESAGR